MSSYFASHHCCHGHFSVKTSAQSCCVIDSSGLTPQVLWLCLSLLWSHASLACFSQFTSCYFYLPWHSYCHGTELQHHSPSSCDYELTLSWSYFLLVPPSEREGSLAELFVYLILGSWINLGCPDMNLGMFFVVVFVCPPPPGEGNWKNGDLGKQKTILGTCFK